MQNRITVLLADDNGEFVQLFSDYLAAQPDFEVVGTASNGSDAYELLIRHRPDVVLLDIIMPKLDGLGLLRKLNEEQLEKRPSVIILSAVSREEATQEALKLGIDYYIVKPFDLRMVADRIRTFHCGNGENSSGSRIPGAEAAGKPALRNLEYRTTRVLLEIGIPPNIQGFQYIRDCVLLQCRKSQYEDIGSHYFYYTLAGQYRTTPVCVERAIHYAKNLAFGKNPGEKSDIFKHSGKKNKAIPSNMEMIRAISDRVKSRV